MAKHAVWGLVFLLFLPTILFAQGTGIGHGKGYGQGKGGCMRLERLGLSEAQQSALKEINKSYQGRIIRIRNRLMIKRFEIKNLLRDPNEADTSVLSKAKEMGVLIKTFREKMVAYQIAIKGILTPEQIVRWCTLVGRPFDMKEWTEGR